MRVCRLITWLSVAEKKGARSHLFHMNITGNIWASQDLLYIRLDEKGPRIKSNYGLLYISFLIPNKVFILFYSIHNHVYIKVQHIFEIYIYIRINYR